MTVVCALFFFFFAKHNHNSWVIWLFLEANYLLSIGCMLGILNLYYATCSVLMRLCDPRENEKEKEYYSCRYILILNFLLAVLFDWAILIIKQGTVNFGYYQFSSYICKILFSPLLFYFTKIISLFFL